MYERNFTGSLNNDFSGLRDLDAISSSIMPLDPNGLVFTPTSMARIESTLIGLDGAFDSDSDSFTDDSNQDWASVTSSTKRRKIGDEGKVKQLPGPKSSRRLEDMTPEEITRRQRRRERNKAAAARCRQRRVDLTNQLLAETQQLESEGQRLEREIEKLRRERDQLEFVLEAHRPMCHGDTADLVKAETVVNDSMQSMNALSAIRPNSLPIVSSMVPVTTPDFSFGLGSTGVTPVVSASGLNLFLGAGTDFMSPTTLLSSPSSLIV